MHIALFVFSGTGNTMYVGSMLCNAFNSLGAETVLYNIETLLKEGEIPGLSNTDAIGIGYPVYAFNTPKIVNAFIKLLPSCKDKRVFFFKTAGEPFYWNDSSSASSIGKLKRKGYKAVFERHFLMPYNIVTRYPDALVKQMLTTNKKLCADMAKRILNGEVYLPGFKLKSMAASVIFRVQWPGAALNGRLYGVRKSCTLCQKCVKSCPVGNIVLKNGRLNFGWKCIMCMRCVMYCPQNAIRFGIMPFWAVNKPYDFDAILKDTGIPDEYVNEKTKGYFKLFKKYYSRVNEMLKDFKN